MASGAGGEAGGAAGAVLVSSLRRVYRMRGRRRGAASERTALADVDLAVERGMWVALLGPNGSGKSTLLRILSTMDRPDSGTVRVCGHDPVTDGAAVRARIGVVFQEPGLDGLLTVSENLRLQAVLGGLPRRERGRRVADVAAAVAVSDRLADRVSVLSGGLRRRADLARALVTSPELLLLDEPTAGVDLAAREAFLDAVAARRAATEMTVLSATHDMAEAERADVVVLMAEGKVMETGTPAGLRSAFGEAVIAADAAWVGEMERAGLTVIASAGDAVGSGAPGAVAEAAASLARAGAAFRVGPPTLGDVYLGMTGGRLAASTEEAS